MSDLEEFLVNLAIFFTLFSISVWISKQLSAHSQIYRNVAGLN